MDSPYLAHIAEDGRTQTVYEHLIGTAALAKEFARPFGKAAQAELAGLAHDIGKYSLAFQKRLHGDTRKVDHSTAGAVECWNLGQPLAAFAVAGHHGGLPDGGSPMDSTDDATLLGRLKRKNQGKLEPYDDWKRELQLPQIDSSDSSSAESPDSQACLKLAFETRMLYSCLVDADYLDTEAFMTGQPRKQTKNASIELLWDKLQSYISGWFPPQGELNRQRCSILKSCMQSGEQQSPGLFSLTVPTGGGKTVASLAFALAHAKAQGLRRVIYVIPYTSIIEQTADVFRSILGDENVLEHHSNVLYDLEGEADARTIRLAQTTENWDMPVIVTTAVQFFESLYACRPSQCRKLHNLANSVIIFDEAQMLPVPYLRPCIHAISQLIEHYHVSAVLCTATQPALQKIFHEFLPAYPITELCPSSVHHCDAFRRVTFRQSGKLTWNELAKQLNEQQQALCIVNSRKNAQELFQKLEEGRFHLSTLMCPAHRRAQLQEIRQRLTDGLPCRVVSTSLIEAGVDVDFPTVYRQLTGLDSILQAAGRCNREGKRQSSKSIVTIFEAEGAVPIFFKMAIDVTKDVMTRHADIASKEAIDKYFCQLLYLKGAQAQDKNQILQTILKRNFSFRTVAERFHLIDSPTKTIYIPLWAGEELVERLHAGARNRSLFRQLGQCGVSVYEKHFNALDEAGDLEILEDGTAILQNISLYSEETGLSLDADNGKGLFI